jgi:hypothetical protein
MATRNGKIAQLPNDIREQLNLRLLEGGIAEPFGVGAGGVARKGASELAAWLNALPEVQSVLGSQFHGASISEVNLTHWRQGGYLQWLTERECFDSARALAEGDCNLATTGLSAERLLNILTVRFGQLLMRWDLPPDEGVSESLAESRDCGMLGGVSRKEAGSFSQVARKARILQGISRSVLAIHRIQSQRSDPSRSLPKNDPLATPPIAVIAPPSNPPVPPPHAAAAENCAEPQTGGASDTSPNSAPTSSLRPVASSNSVPGLAAAISGRLRALRGRAGARPEILSGPIAPSIHLPTFPVSALRSPVSLKPDLDLTEILHAV